MPHLCRINDLSQKQILALFKRADLLKSISSDELNQRHSQRILANLFFEPSTRTRLSFESAAKQLGMHVLTMNESNSSRVKGESYLDTLLTLRAVGAEVFVIRSKDENICAELAQQMTVLHPETHIINGGGGTMNHPTQGLLDAYTMLQHFDDLSEKKIVIIGDIKHSRVARSTVQVLNKLGLQNITLVAPTQLLPVKTQFSDCEFSSDLDKSLNNADVVMALRIQKERMLDSDIPDAESYHAKFGLNAQRLANTNNNAIVMHPGPMNRGVEITSDVADGSQSVIEEQVRNGLFIRMALFDIFLDSNQQ